MLGERCQGDEQFGIGRFAEILDADIARVVVEHIGRGDAVLRNVATGDGELLNVFLSEAHHADFHLRVFRAFQPSHGLLARHFLADETAVVDGYDFVACQQSGTFRRAVFHDILNANRVLADDKFDAHARKRAFQVVVADFHVLRRQIDGMRVEFDENLRNGFLDERVDVYGIDILVVDDVQQVVEAVAAAVDDVQPVSAEVVGVESADDDAEHHAEREHQGHIPVFVVHIHCILVTHINHFDSCAFEQVDSVAEPVVFAIDDALDAGLNDEFCALDAGRGRDVDGRAFAVVV